MEWGCCKVFRQPVPGNHKDGNKFLVSVTAGGHTAVNLLIHQDPTRMQPLKRECVIRASRSLYRSPIVLF